jgi:hypothetical protein
MTTENPDEPRAVSSTPVLRTALVWGGVVGAVVIAAAAVIGAIVAGGAGAASGALGGAVGAVFPALTAVSILVANRWYGNPAWLQIFFGIVLGGWVLKFIVVIVAFVVLLRVDWVVPFAFYFSLVAAAIASIIVDLVVLRRMRLPGVSDIELPRA